MGKKYNHNCFREQNYDPSFLAGAFLRGMAFGKNVRAFTDAAPVMTVTSRQDILLAVKKAYGDLSPRTFKIRKDWWECPENVRLNSQGKPKPERLPEKENAWQVQKNEVFSWLSQVFYTYFQEDCGDFEQWHEAVCKEFLARFQPALEAAGYNGAASLKYGKAQKIVNMTFKYLFCFDDAQVYGQKFAPCHMPVDSYILRWYGDVSGEKCPTSWSELDQTQYLEIQKTIRKALGNHSPLLAEFYIWAEYNSP